MKSRQIAHYELGAKLGEGGMGEVYRATDTKLGREVAIKLLPDSFAADPVRFARFTRESRVLASLNHPNIATIHGVEDRALVMELVEGADLAGPLPLEDALKVLHQIIDALEYAHEKGIVHRDLKPANIRITREGRIKILDFGLAKAMSEDDPLPSDPTISPTLTMRHTMAGAIVGTPAYMSPEQARGQAIDKRTDIWAFGVVAYEIFTGKPLFAQASVTDTLARVLTQQPDLSALPERLRRLVVRCLERDPRRRLRDIGDARLLLDETQAETAAVPSGRLPWVIAGSAAICAAAALAFSFWVRPEAKGASVMRFSMDAAAQTVLSPDGKWILSYADPLRVRPLDGVSWRVLPGTEGAQDPFWSSDSSAIGFVANGQLRTLSLNSVTPSTVTNAPDFRGGTWRGGTSDGAILFSSAGNLQFIDLRSGTLRKLPLRAPDGGQLMDPVFLPEGEGFLYEMESNGHKALYRSSLSSRGTTGERVLDTSWIVQIARRQDNGRWYLFYIPGSSDRALMAREIDPRSGILQGTALKVVEALSSRSSGRWYAFTVANNGVAVWRYQTTSQPIWRLMWLDRNGNVLGTIGDRSPHVSMALSPDDSRVAVLSGYPTEHVWLFNQSGAASRLSSHPGGEGYPIWSPDGQTVYYTTFSENLQQIVGQKIVAGAAPEVLYEIRNHSMPSLQDISADGRHLLLIFDPPYSSDVAYGLYEMDLSVPSNERALRPVFVRQDLGSIQRARFMLDQKSVLVGTGKALYQIRFPVDGGPPRQLSSLQGTTPAAPFFSHDGRQLYLVGREQGITVQPLITDPGGNVRLGDRTFLFRLMSPARASANLAAITHDGARFLAISTDQEDEVRTQVINDWMALVKP